MITIIISLLKLSKHIVTNHQKMGRLKGHLDPNERFVINDMWLDD